MAVRKRVWLNHKDCNYNDRKKVLIDESNYAPYVLYEEENTHFNHGDFLNSSCITIPTIEIFDRQPNYLLIFNGTVLESRWYVNNFQFISGEPTGNKSKFTASLLRDVIVDNRGSFANKLAKVRRGTLPRDIWSPLLVQPEGEMLNKVKVGQEQIKLWDKDTRWLTFLYDQTSPNTTITFDWTNDIVPDYQLTTMQSDYTSRAFTAPTKGNIVTNPYKRSWIQWQGNISIPITVRRYGGLLGNSVVDEYTMTYHCTVQVTSYGTSITGASVTGNFGSYWSPSQDDIRTQVAAALTPVMATVPFSTASNLTSYNYDKSSQYEFLRNKYDSRIVNDGVNNIRTTFSNTSGESSITSGITALNSEMAAKPNGYNTGQFNLQGSGSSVLTFWAQFNAGGSTTGTPMLSLTDSNFTTELSSIPNNGTLVLPQSFKLDEMNLGCVAIPFGQDVKIVNGSSSWVIDDQTIKSIATTGWTEAGSWLKDIQILPYCPVGILNSLNFQNSPSNNINIANLPNPNILVPLTVTGSNTILYYGVANTQSSMDYRYDVSLANYLSSDIKMDSITKNIRMVSHNHKTIFEFNPRLNGSSTSLPLSISYTIRPFNTVFRICPVFSTEGLYGGNFKDSRGLIYEGGMSLSQITSQWVEYKLQNSTYESVFNREIANQEISQEGARAQETLSYTTENQNANTQIQAAKDKANLALGMGMLGAAGASVAGYAKGGPVGAVLGVAAGGAAVLGSHASAQIGIGAQQEIAANNLRAGKESQMINDGLRQESLAYKKDIFALNNQAIQAAPNSLVSSTDYSHISDVKCYFEFYDCTLQEKQFLEAKLTYQGMKIGALGVLKDFISGNMAYIEGTLLFDAHSNPIIGNAINAELNKGIYIEGGLFNG